MKTSSPVEPFKLDERARGRADHPKRPGMGLGGLRAAAFERMASLQVRAKLKRAE